MFIASHVYAQYKLIIKLLHSAINLIALWSLILIKLQRDDAQVQIKADCSVYGLIYGNSLIILTICFVYSILSLSKPLFPHTLTLFFSN